MYGGKARFQVPIQILKNSSILVIVTSYCILMCYTIYVIIAMKCTGATLIFFTHEK